jgi:hypothetical protein
VPFLLVPLEDGSRRDLFRSTAVVAILLGFLDDVLVLALLLGAHAPDVLPTWQFSNLLRFHCGLVDSTPARMALPRRGQVRKGLDTLIGMGEPGLQGPGSSTRHRSAPVASNPS